MGIAQTTRVETGGRGRGCREAEKKSGRVADGFGLSKIACNWSGSGRHSRGAGAPICRSVAVLTVGAGFRTCMSPARHEGGGPRGSARLRPRVVVIGPTWLAYKECSISGTALPAVAHFLCD